MYFVCFVVLRGHCVFACHLSFCVCFVCGLIGRERDRERGMGREGEATELTEQSSPGILHSIVSIPFPDLNFCPQAFSNG